MHFPFHADRLKYSLCSYRSLERSLACLELVLVNVCLDHCGKAEAESLDARAKFKLVQKQDQWTHSVSKKCSAFLENTSRKLLIIIIFNVIIFQISES